VATGTLIIEIKIHHSVYRSARLFRTRLRRIARLSSHHRLARMKRGHRRHDRIARAKQPVLESRAARNGQ